MADVTPTPEKISNSNFSAIYEEFAEEVKNYVKSSESILKKITNFEKTLDEKTQ